MADGLVVVHFAFVFFVALGGFLVAKWHKVAFLHLPAAAWAVMIEFSGWICPLTPLENGLRHAAGDGGYSGTFIEQYILPILYPSGLTRELQIMIGIALLAGNGLIYIRLFIRKRRQRQSKIDDWPPDHKHTR
jgi:hypothetical protein